MDNIAQFQALNAADRPFRIIGRNASKLCRMARQAKRKISMAVEIVRLSYPPIFIKRMQSLLEWHLALHSTLCHREDSLSGFVHQQCHAKAKDRFISSSSLIGSSATLEDVCQLWQQHDDQSIKETVLWEYLSWDYPDYLKFCNLIFNADRSTVAVLKHAFGNVGWLAICPDRGLTKWIRGERIAESLPVYATLASEVPNYDPWATEMTATDDRDQKSPFGRIKL